MKRCRLSHTLIVACAALLGGCVQHTFAPGPGMSAADFEPDSARCRLFARGANPGQSFEAYGSQQFVAASMTAAMVGGAIGDAIRTNVNYNDCMEAHGWRVADRPPPSAAAAPPLAATAAVVATADTARLAPRRELDIKVEPMNDAMASSLQVDPPRGVVVMAVMPGGVGASAGLHPNDVILDFAGMPVMTLADLQRDLASIAANSVVLATIWREYREQVVRLRF